MIYCESQNIFCHCWLVKGFLISVFKSNIFISQILFQLLDGILLTQGRSAGAGTHSSSDLIYDLADDILEKLPPDFDIEMVIINLYFLLYYLHFDIVNYCYKA